MTPLAPGFALEFTKSRAPGLLVTLVVAMAAAFLGSHYKGSVLLFSLLLGLAMHFVSEDKRCAAGIQFASSTVLRLGVAWANQVAARQIPDQWQVTELLEHLAVAPAHLFRAQNAAQGVVDVRVSSRLVKDQVAIQAVGDGLLQPSLELAVGSAFFVVEVLA